MTSRLSRVGIAASNLFDPMEPAAPNSLRSGSGTYRNLHRFPTSVDRRNVARSLFLTPNQQECNRWPRPR